MKKSTKKTLAISGVAAFGITAVTIIHRLTLKYLMRIALDRKAPKAVDRHRDKFIGSKETAKLLKSVSATSDKLKYGDCETVFISSHDGIRLVGHWHECENAGRIIIAMHGWRSSWSQDFGAISDFWHDNKCSVLYVEQRSHGDSHGDYMGFGVLERYDCFEWIKWVNKRTDGKLPIYLAGISMGATTVLMASGFNLPENVKGIIADCGFSSPRAIWKHVVERHLHLPYGIYKSTAEDMYRQKNKVSMDYSCSDALQNCRIPVLFIHGSDDRFVPIDMTFENYKACASQKELLIVVGAEHGMSYLVDKESYEAKIKDFWEKYDNLKTKL